MNIEETDPAITQLIVLGIQLKQNNDTREDGEKLLNAALKMSELVDCVEEMRRALRPFAEEADAIEKEFGPQTPSTITGTIYFEDLRTARVAFSRA